MSRREAVLSAALVFVVALIVRAFFAAQIVFPKPEDTAYYVGVARNLIDGRGLVSDALWSYATPPLVFPRPAFEVWLPLPTFLAAIPMADSARLRGGPALERPDRSDRSGAPLAARRRRRATSEGSRPTGSAGSGSVPGSPAQPICRWCSTRRCPIRRWCSPRSSSARPC